MAGDGDADAGEQNVLREQLAHAALQRLLRVSGDSGFLVFCVAIFIWNPYHVLAARLTGGWLLLQQRSGARKGTSLTGCRVNALVDARPGGLPTGRRHSKSSRHRPASDRRRTRASHVAMPLPYLQESAIIHVPAGEMDEWFKSHAWKACIG